MTSTEREPDITDDSALSQCAAAASFESLTMIYQYEGEGEDEGQFRFISNLFRARELIQGFTHSPQSVAI